MNIILACDNKYGIGINNTLPSWKLKEDMKKFKKVTIKNGHNVVIMGKNTFLSLKQQPLKHRTNIVVSASLYKLNSPPHSDYCIIDSFIICKDIESAVLIAKSFTSIWDDSEIWIIGGAIIYDSFVQKYIINKFFLTWVEGDFNCDIFLRPSTIDFINKLDWTNIKKHKNFTFFEYNNDIDIY
tara:strand:- start:8539 stop:9087 length:549 start_codon:yes stop_codon:yes gene_type:complete